MSGSMSWCRTPTAWPSLSAECTSYEVRFGSRWSLLPSTDSLASAHTDGHSTTGPLKPTKFRVEFSSHTSLNTSPLLGAPSSADRALYPTLVTLVMEKGAHSTFKATYNRLRAGWE